MKKISLGTLILAFVVTLLTACGGGGDVSTSQPTKAVLTLSSAVTGSLPANTIINGYDVTISLPAGVTAGSTQNPPQTDDGVVTASGAAAGAGLAYGVYTAATVSAPASVRIFIAKADGMNSGEFSKVNCDIGYTPQASDFPLSAFKAVGVYTSPSGTYQAGDSVDLTDQLAASLTVATY